MGKSLFVRIFSNFDLKYYNSQKKLAEKYKFEFRKKILKENSKMKISS